MPSPVQKVAFFGALESLRGLAALLVVLYHLPFAPIHRIGIARNGHAAVEFFFVLSGFVFMHTYVARARLQGKGALRRFVLLRLARIYPVHALFTVAFVVIELLKYVGGRLSTVDLQVDHGLPSILRAFVENALLVHGLGLAPRELFLNFPSWSISTEFFTYIVFGVGVVSFSRRGFLAFAAATSVACFGVLALFATSIGETQQFVRCLAGFFLGCLVYEIYSRRRVVDPGFDLPGLFLVMMLVLFSCSWGSDAISWQVGLPVAAIFVLSVVLTTPRGTTKLLERPQLRWLGRISYSLYMCHAFVLYLARHGARFLPKAADGEIPLIVGSLYFGLSVVVVVLVGWMVHRLVEVPAHEWGKALVEARMGVRERGASALGFVTAACPGDAVSSAGSCVARSAHEDVTKSS